MTVVRAKKGVLLSCELARELEMAAQEASYLVFHSAEHRCYPFSSDGTLRLSSYSKHSRIVKLAKGIYLTPAGVGKITWKWFHSFATPISHFMLEQLGPDRLQEAIVKINQVRAETLALAS